MTKNIFLIIFGSISLATNIVVDIKNIPNSNSKIYLAIKGTVCQEIIELFIKDT